MKLGATDISKIYLGSTEVTKAYLGSTLVHGSDTLLPYDAEVEYLQSDSDSYINTGINVSSSLKTVIQFALGSNFTLANISLLFGVWKSPNGYSVSVPSLSQIRVPSGNSFAVISCNIGNYNTKHTLSYKRGDIWFDNAKIGTNTTSVSSTTIPVRLFGRNAEADASSTADIILYSCQMYNGGTLVRDYIPVRKGTTGYLYDRVSGQLFGNAGTGSFTYGNDVI